MASAPDLKSVDDATALALWVVETVAAAAGVEVDPLATRRLVREQLSGRSQVSEAGVVQVLNRAAEAAGLELRPVVLTPQGLETAPLPLVSWSGGGVALVERDGARYRVLRPDAEARWQDGAAVVAQAPQLWLTAAPAAPLQPLRSAAGGHASPGARLWALMRLERDELWVVALFAAVVGLLTLAVPVAVQALVGTVAFGTLLQPIVVLSVLLLLALGFQAALKALQAWAVEALQQRVFVRTSVDLAWRLPRVKRDEAGPDFGPETVNRFFDVLTVQKTAHILLTDGVATLLQLGIGLLVLAFYHPALLAFDLVLLALLGVVILAPLRRGLSTSLAESAAKYAVAAWLQELARPGTALRSAGGAAFAAERADALTRRYLQARRSHFSVLFGQKVGTLAVQVFASASLLGLGGWLVVQQSLTLGQLVAAELIVASVAASISRSAKLLDSTYDLLTGLDKLGHLVDLPTEDPERGDHVPGRGPLRVEVRGATDGDAAPIDLEVPARARMSVVGAEGHALGAWLSGERVPGRGVVRLNGVETARAQACALREEVAFVHRGDFFEGTVLENLTLGRPGVTTGVARAALERVGLLDEVYALPKGLDAPLQASGAPLTHSQLTRLLVARAIAASPRLLVVDESLESIEPEARARCVEALTRPGAPWTLVALVPDASVALAQACDRVVDVGDLSPLTARVAS